MSIESKVLAKKYAVAFLNIFSDQLKMSDCQALEKVAKYLDDHIDLFFLLRAPFIDKKKQQQAFEKLGEHYKLPAVIQKVADLLRSDNRFYLMPDVLEAVVKEYWTRNNIMRFSVVSSQELSSDDLSSIEKFLALKTNKKIIIDYKIDDSLIAGLRLQSATLLWEHSIQEQLQTIKKKILRQELIDGH